MSAYNNFVRPKIAKDDDAPRRLPFQPRWELASHETRSICDSCFGAFVECGETIQGDGTGSDGWDEEKGENETEAARKHGEGDEERRRERRYSWKGNPAPIL